VTKQHDDEYGHYSLILEWDPRDDIYVVTVPELPGCRTHGSTYEEAVAQAQDAIASWVDAAREDGDPAPPPRTFALGPEEAAEPVPVGSGALP
jgi:predicted RNase H-like HicB family nuclease